MPRQTQEELISKLTLVGVALAGTLMIVLSSGVFTLWSMVAGAVLLLLLLTYSQHGQATQTRMEHAASSAVLALSSLLLLGWLLQLVYQLLGLERWSVLFPIGGLVLSLSWALVALALWLTLALIWMRIDPKERWPRLFQPLPPPEWTERRASKGSSSSIAGRLVKPIAQQW